MAPVGGTTVGPLAPETRDMLAKYRDERDHSSYEDALYELLEAAQNERPEPVERGR